MSDRRRNGRDQGGIRVYEHDRPGTRYPSWARNDSIISYCEVDGCTATSNGRPFCIEHSPYVAEVRAQLGDASTPAATEPPQAASPTASTTSPSTPTPPSSSPEAASTAEDPSTPTPAGDA